MKIISENGKKFYGTRILPTKAILSNHSEQLKELLVAIADKENVSVRDAAQSLTNILKNVMNTDDINPQ